MPVVDLSTEKPVPGTLGDANQIANGFMELQAAINALDNLNFAAGKIFDLTKLMQGGAAVVGQPLVWDGANWIPANLGIELAAGASGIFRANQVAGNVVIRNKLLAADAQSTWFISGSGAIFWGPGGAGGVDTTLYRDAAGNRLKTDDNFVAADGLTTKVKAGVPLDGDFQIAPPDGTVVLDSTSSIFWTRIGGVWVPQGTFDRVTTGVDVANTVTETSIYSKSVPAGIMGTNRMLVLTAFGDYLHNSVAGDTVTFRVKFGGTTFFANASNLGNILGASRQPWVLTLFVLEGGSTNSQWIFGMLNIHDANDAAPTTGIGTIASGRDGIFGIAAAGAIDTTVAQTLDVTAQWSAANANNSFRQRGASLELK